MKRQRDLESGKGFCCPPLNQAANRSSENSESLVKNWWLHRVKNYLTAATYDHMWQWPHGTFNQFTVMVFKP